MGEIANENCSKVIIAQIKKKGKRQMKLPNQYGSVYKLAGKRRRPWVARRTIGWKTVEGKKAQPIYKMIGYYTTKKEALEALAEYNRNPLDGNKKMTFAKLYEEWSKDFFESDVSNSTIAGYTRGFKNVKGLHDLDISKIRLADLQEAMDQANKNKPELANIKKLYKKIFEYAIKKELIPPDKVNMIHYVEIKAGNPNARAHKLIPNKLLKNLWSRADEHDVQIILILIYTGVRINELLLLKKENVYLEKKYFSIMSSKTDAGIRDVPIADKIFKFVESLFYKDKNAIYLIDLGKNNYTQRTIKPAYRYYTLHSWDKILKDYTPHDTRHTCISLLTEAQIDERIIQQIVGHKATGVTRAVYTHISISSKLEAINKI